MQDMLKEIKAVGSVIGSYIHINGVSEIHSDLPKIFLKKIYEVGMSLDRVIKVNESTKMQANNIELTYEEAVNLLRKIVKHSHLDNQKHIDLSLALAPDRVKYQEAMVVVQESVAKGERTEEELKHDLGLI